MSGIWIPGLVVLIAGLVGGVLAFRRISLAGAGKHSERDLELEISDLETRRDDLYRRLRGETGEELSVADRENLELAAARTLRDLDVAVKKRAATAPGASRKKSKKGKKGRKETESRQPEAPKPSEPAVAAQAAPSGWMGRHPILAGFALGAGMVAVVGVLIYWAVRDAKPGPPPPPTPRGASAPAPSAAEPHPEAALPPAAQAELETLNSRIEANPADIQAVKERALLLLRFDRFVEAFGDSETILQSIPGDIDGTYIQGVVRLAMGQDDAARASLERVVELFPNHFQALTWLGILDFRAGDFDAAVATWERGMAAAGGDRPEIQRLIDEARRVRDEQGAQMASSSAPPAAPASTSAAQMVAPALPPPSAVPGAYSVRVAVSPGQRVPAGILYLSVRDGGGGPPIAVHRIDSPVFPLDAAITQEHSMMGQPLPPSATITATLDTDGSVATKSPEDLSAAGLAELGGTVELTLVGG